MAATFDRELRQILEKADCRQIRSGKGSHEIWYSPITQRRFPVDQHILSRHTANGVLKQAGIAKQF